MKTLIPTLIPNSNTQTIRTPATTMSHILALGALDERACVSHLQKVVAAHCPDSFAKKALDINAGKGVCAMALAELGFRVAAFDMYRSSISVVQKLAVKQDLNISFRVGNVMQIQNINEKFDLVHDRECLASNCSNTDRQDFLQTIREVLAVDGKFVLSTPVLVGEFEPAESFESVRLDNNNVLWRQTPECDLPGVLPLHGKHWTAQKKLATPEMLRAEIHVAGFKIVSEELEIIPGLCTGTMKMVLA